MKKHYYLILDVETANTTQDALVYDIGFVVTDIQGKIYEKHSYINKDIFEGEQDLMKSAYYSEKIPTYMQDIKNGKRALKSLYEIKQIVFDIFKRYPIQSVGAYNTRFDYTALNTTMRYETKSKYRYFFPYGIELFDIWHMACQSICSQKKYYDFCITNGYVSKSGNISTSAETVYKFLKQDTNFQEEHKGLDDVLIETEIMVECYKKKVKLNKSINPACWRIPQRTKNRKGK